MSGGPAGLEGDVIAKCLELVDGLVLSPLGVASRVVVGAGIVVEGSGGQHAPDEHQQGV